MHNKAGMKTWLHAVRAVSADSALHNYIYLLTSATWNTSNTFPCYSELLPDACIKTEKFFVLGSSAKKRHAKPDPPRPTALKISLSITHSIHGNTVLGFATNFLAVYYNQIFSSYRHNCEAGTLHPPTQIERFKLSHSLSPSSTSTKVGCRGSKAGYILQQGTTHWRFILANYQFNQFKQVICSQTILQQSVKSWGAEDNDTGTENLTAATWLADRCMKLTRSRRHFFAVKLTTIPNMEVAHPHSPSIGLE